MEGFGTASGVATAAFETSAGWRAAGRRARWTGDQVGAHTVSFAGYAPGSSGGFTPTGGGFTVTGAGDLAPATRSDVPIGAAAGDLLIGTFPALVVIVVVATLFDHHRVPVRA